MNTIYRRGQDVYSRRIDDERVSRNSDGHRAGDSQKKENVLHGHDLRGDKEAFEILRSENEKAVGSAASVPSRLI